MGLTKNRHELQIGDAVIAVVGSSGPVHATWTLLVDGVEVDQASAAGDFTLRGDHPDGSLIAVKIHQSLIGPVDMDIVHGGDVVGHYEGFVA